MDIILFTFIVTLRFVVVVSDKYKILPPVFKLEDYVACLEKSYSYCKIDVRLKNDGFNNNDLWNLINDSINDRYGYDRSVIQRGICVTKKDAFNLESVKNFAELRINEEFNGTNLLTLVENIFCISNQDKTGISLYDKLLVFSLAAYMSLIVYATIYDRQRRTCTGESTKDKAILSFSLISNWKKICNIEGNDDFKNLKSIQGIRFYNMLLIIALHTFVTYGVLCISNTSYTEKLLSTTPAQIFQVLSVFLVQTFFLISSFIVTFQIYNIYRDQGKFTIKQALIIITNRFFRIGVCSTVVLIILKSSLDTLTDGPHIYDYCYIFRQACKHNWQQTFYFFNNYLHYEDMCQPLAWYLSVDFQLYIFVTVLIYFIIKFKLDELKIVSFLIPFSCLLYGSVIYFNQMDIILRLNANTLRRPILLRSEPLRTLYTSTYSNWTTSLVGILLGIQYTKYKNYNFHNNKVRSILWLSIFFGLPSAVILISTYEFKGFQAAILGALIKPLFSLGIGIGILGMSHNMGGIIKRVCEYKYVLVLSNFSFATYLFQIFTLIKGDRIYSLVEIKLTEMIKTFFFFDMPASLVVGMVCTLIFEQPGINLQKLFLPQISRGQKRQKSQ